MNLRIRPLIAILFCLLPILRNDCSVAAQSVAGLTVTLNPVSGTYTVGCWSPKWSFSGSVGSPMSMVAHSSGKDAIGQFTEVSFDWTDGQPYIGTIRTYAEQSTALFSIESVGPLSGPTPDFPAFSSFPAQMHAMSYRDDVFSPHAFSLEQTSTPWVLFDDRAETAVLSPASDFMVAQMHGNGKTLLASGIEPKIQSLPAGFTHRTVLTMGQGIEATVHQWGDALTALSGKTRSSDDSSPMIEYYGYWTDNGATYYYNYDTSKGYTGTLLALRDLYAQEGIPLHYLQLDSWWYQKSHTYQDGSAIGWKNPSLPQQSWNTYGGTLDYSASPALFPQGLGKFDQDLGMPLAVHSRWIDPASPYHATYKISGVAAIDPRYWDDRTKYLAQNGVFCYEQDWLNWIYADSPEMATNLDVSNAFTDNMALAAKANGETIQYCMATPRFFLQGSKYDNLTTIRTSDDSFVRPRWNDFLYTGMLADALHVRPWADVCKSSDQSMMLMEDLSTGPVGTGDRMGQESKENILMALRGDGEIIRPDAPLLPTDSSIIADANNAHAPLIASTYTNNGLKTVYVMAFTRDGDGSSITFTPSSFGLSGDVYVCTYGGTAIEQDAAAPFTDTLGPSGWAYYTIAPVGRFGVAFLGDSNKYVGTGRARIDTVTDGPSAFTATLVTSPDEPAVTLGGYCSFALKARTTGGLPAPVSYDPGSRHFTVQVSCAKAEISRNGKEAKITVIFERAKPPAVNPV